MILFLLGLALNLLPSFQLSTLRYCGVLQRIAVTFWLANLCLVCLPEIALPILVAALLLGYWGLLTLVPVPGFRLTGLQLGVLNPTANVASALDRILIAPAHLYHHSFYDPEGVLSTLVALASVLVGILAGQFVRRTHAQPGQGTRLTRLAGYGVSLACLALLWNQVFPFNKRLWTSSYALWAAGLDIALLAALSYALDRPDTPWAGRTRALFLVPWKAFGSNALAAYILSEVLGIAIQAVHLHNGLTLQQQSFRFIPVWAGPPALRSLVWSLAFTAFCFLPIYGLYRRHILIKL